MRGDQVLCPECNGLGYAYYSRASEYPDGGMDECEFCDGLGTVIDEAVKEHHERTRK